VVEKMINVSVAMKIVADLEAVLIVAGMVTIAESMSVVEVANLLIAKLVDPLVNVIIKVAVSLQLAMKNAVQ
jgi:hypothetical protein